MLTTLPQIFGNSGFVKTAWKLRTEREKMKYWGRLQNAQSMNIEKNEAIEEKYNVHNLN